MKKLLITIVFAGLMLSSCKKNNDDVDTSKTYLSKETLVGIGVNTWTYDAQNKLTNVEFTSVNEAANPSYNFRITALNANGSIVEALQDFVSASGTDYKIVNDFSANGKLASVTYIDAATNTPKFTYTYTYTANQVTILYKNAAGVVQYSWVYTFSADEKNVVKLESYNAAAVLQNTYTYAGFDDKNSPQSVYVPGFSLSPVGANNFTASNFTTAAGVTTASAYTFEYNSDGYATKRISASGAANLYEYIKK